MDVSPRTRLITAYRREVTLENCGFECIDPECLVRSQWQSRSKNSIYLVYRWCVAVFVVAVVIVSMIYNEDELRRGIFFAYLTRWGILTNMIVGVLGAVLVTIWHFHTDFYQCVYEHREMPLSFKIYWALHNIALVISFVITIVYWTMVNSDGDKHPVDASNILSHAFNSAIMLVDIVIVSYPLRLYHVYQPLCFGICYGLFSFIYYKCGGVDIHGNRYIYKAVDWNDPWHAFQKVILTLVLATIVHIALFGLCKLRTHVQKRYFSHPFLLTGINRQTSYGSVDSQITVLA